MIVTLMQKANLLLGFMPESLGLLVFGIALIGSTIILRRIFNEQEEAVETDEELKRALRKLR